MNNCPVGLFQALSADCRDMDELDYYSYAGASPEARITTLEIDGDAYDIIIDTDDDDVVVQVFDTNDTTQAWQWRLPQTPAPEM